MTTNAEVRRIRALLERVFEGEAWHGPPILDVLSELDWATARARPVRGGNSIWEIVNHIAAWVAIVRRRAEGEPVSEVDPTMDWPPCELESAVAWDEAREHLRTCYADLSASLEAMDDDRLADRIQGKVREYTVYDDLHGVIQHSLYHMGQIVILAKASRSEAA